jgi:hypothetical protein
LIVGTSAENGAEVKKWDVVGPKVERKEKCIMHQIDLFRSVLTTLHVGKKFVLTHNVSQANFGIPNFGLPNIGTI